MKQTADQIRTELQNKKMWPMLTDISRQLVWPVLYDGKIQARRLDQESWKAIITAGLERQQLMAQGIDGGWVLLGSSTRKMSIARMRELIDLIKHFGDSKQVQWSDPKQMTYAQYLEAAA